MLSFRAATENDRPSILRVMDEADLHFTGETLDNFYLAESGQETAGIVRLEEQKDFFFLSSLGVLKKFRKQGVASFLLNNLLKGRNKKIYLYTVIPDFFLPFGFQPAGSVPPTLPAKETFGCDLCLPGKCVRMVK